MCAKKEWKIMKRQAKIKTTKKWKNKQNDLRNSLEKITKQNILEGLAQTVPEFI